MPRNISDENSQNETRVMPPNILSLNSFFERNTLYGKVKRSPRHVVEIKKIHNDGHS